MTSTQILNELARAFLSGSATDSPLRVLARLPKH
jgi:hypothetical protein